MPKIEIINNWLKALNARRYVSHLVVGAIFASLSCASMAQEACSPKTQWKGRITRIEYSIDRYYPTFMIEHSTSWMELAPSQGVNKYYGRAMLSIALTAFVSGAEIEIKDCNNGKVNQIIINGN